MKSLNNIRKNSQRRKLKNTRKRNNNKTNKKIKKGGNPTLFAQEHEYKHRIKIGNLIQNLRSNKDINEGIKNEKIKNLFSRLISMVFMYKNIYTFDELTFQNHNELYREYLYYNEQDKLNVFFDKYNDFNKLLDRIEKDYNLETDFYKNKYLSLKNSDEITQKGDDNNNDNDDDNDDNNLETSLLKETNNKKSSDNGIWKMLGF
jgi:hypothetical protein